MIILRRAKRQADYVSNSWQFVLKEKEIRIIKIAIYRKYKKKILLIMAVMLPTCPSAVAYPFSSSPHDCRRSRAVLLLEDAAEMGGILKTKTIGNVCHGKAGRLEHLVGFRQSLLSNPAGRRLAVDVLELALETRQ